MYLRLLSLPMFPAIRDASLLCCDVGAACSVDCIEAVAELGELSRHSPGIDSGGMPRNHVSHSRSCAPPVNRGASAAKSMAISAKTRR